MTCAVPWVTERTQCAISCFIGGNVTHRMRVRLTARNRILDRKVRQALFVAGSHGRHLHVVSNLVCPKLIGCQNQAISLTTA
jgi:hypothetical protein